MRGKGILFVRDCFLLCWSPYFLPPQSDVMLAGYVSLVCGRSVLMRLTVVRRGHRFIGERRQVVVYYISDVFGIKHLNELYLPLRWMFRSGYEELRLAMASRNGWTQTGRSRRSRGCCWKQRIRNNNQLSAASADPLNRPYPRHCWDEDAVQNVIWFIH